MDEVLFIGTVYNAGGARIALFADADLKKMAERTIDYAIAWAPGTNYKLWRCEEIPAPKREEV